MYITQVPDTHQALPAIARIVYSDVMWCLQCERQHQSVALTARSEGKPLHLTTEVMTQNFSEGPNLRNREPRADWAID